MNVARAKHNMIPNGLQEKKPDHQTDWLGGELYSHFWKRNSSCSVQSHSFWDKTLSLACADDELTWTPIGS